MPAVGADRDPARPSAQRRPGPFRTAVVQPLQFHRPLTTLWAGMSLATIVQLRRKRPSETRLTRPDGLQRLAERPPENIFTGKVRRWFRRSSAPFSHHQGSFTRYGHGRPASGASASGLSSASGSDSSAASVGEGSSFGLASGNASRSGCISSSCINTSTSSTGVCA
jgi:hypothetical protein